MRGYTPTIEIDVDGKPIASAFWSVLISATLTENEGDEVDRLVMRLDDRGRQIESPRKGAQIAVRYGYRETGVVDKGLFKVEAVAIEGSDERGEFLTIEAHAADLRGEAKAAGQRDYQGKTFGQIVEEEARAMGLDAVVDPDLAKIVFPWRVRWNASRVDFLTRLADEVGGVMKPAGGKLIVQKRGSGRSASGQDMPPLRIVPADCSAWLARPVGRLQYGEVVTYWTDPETGQQRLGRAPTGRRGPPFTIRDPFATEEAARAAAEAAAGRLNRSSGTLSLTLYGRPDATAGVKIETNGFRDEMNGEWTASSVTHTFTSPDAYQTEIEAKAPDKGKEEDEE